MKRIQLLAFAVLVLTASAVHAQNPDSWVAAAGNDANSCTQGTPCLTFAKAFSVTAAGGTIHTVNGGAYGTLTITHSVTIDGGGMAATSIIGGAGYNCGPQFTINAGASDIVAIQNISLTGLRVPCSASAIKVNTVGALHVENSVFTAFLTRAIDFGATSGYLTMKNVTITDMLSGTGVYVANSRAALDNVMISNTQTGVLSAGSSTVSIVRSALNGNGTALAAAYGSTAQLNVDECLLSNNQWAIVVSQGATAYVGRSSLVNNFVKALYNDGASFLVSYGTNQFAGNATDGTFTSGMAVR